MIIRLNDYHDLPVIQALYEASGKHIPPFSWTGDWTGWWLIAEDVQGIPLGCIQLRPSVPMATLELLCVPTCFTKRRKVVVIKTLVREAILRLAGLGASVIQFCINEHREQWAHIAERYGATLYSPYPSYTLRITPCS